MSPQPIDTAPKDRAILAWFPRTPLTEGGWKIAQWSPQRFSLDPNPHWARDCGDLGVQWMLANPPTHWLELPEAP